MIRRLFFVAGVLGCVAALAVSARAGEEWREAEWNARSALEAHRAAVVSAEIGGRVVRVHREMGQAFKRGDALIDLDDRLARADLASAKAVLDAATASLDAASGMYDRNSASQVELAEARRDVAEAAARLERARHQAEACAIVAPFDGRVAEVMVSEHELVEKGRPVVSLIDDSRLVAKFLFPEEKFGQVGIGDVLIVRIPVAGVSREARVSHIAPALDPASRTLDVWAAVDNADAVLRAGMTAEIAPETEDAAR